MYDSGRAPWGSQSCRSHIGAIIAPTVTGKVVFITGASSGNGQACARRLARRGYQVFGTSRRPPPEAEEPFEMITMDVTDETSVRQAVAIVAEIEATLAQVWGEDEPAPAEA